MPSTYFALVMATGVIAVAASELGVPVVPQLLGVLNVVAYAVLVTLEAARLIRSPREVFTELTEHVSGPGFFTVVAATAVLGSQVVTLWNAWTVAQVLWVASALLWLVLSYTIFAALTIKENKPSLEKGISGGWLLAVVATQAVVVLGMVIAPVVPATAVPYLHFACLALWSWGGMLYVLTMALIFYRYEFFALSPQDLSPPYWISMGAMAISTLAGTMLLAAGEAGASHLLASLTPVTKGASVLFWATGTWWIPLLVVLGVWRHVARRFPLRYEVSYWGMVFPLGMYALCTLHLADALDLGFLVPVSSAFLVFALLAWTLTFYGLARGIVYRARPVPRR